VFEPVGTTMQDGVSQSRVDDGEEEYATTRSLEQITVKSTQTTMTDCPSYIFTEDCKLSMQQIPITLPKPKQFKKVATSLKAIRSNATKPAIPSWNLRITPEWK
jgi:hypothetical protein